MARIASVDGRPVEDIAGLDGNASRRLTREHRLTSRAELTPDNRVVEGAWWSDPARDEVSLEERFARDLRLGIGDVVEFDVQGVPVGVVVTSLRRVDWQSLSINFFVVVEPGVLDAAPALHLMSARVPPANERMLQERLSREFPNVTVLRLGAILEQVGALVGRVAAGVGALGSFSALAGVFVLAGAASAAALRRRGEVALLKVLGATRGGVALLFALEFGAAGALAGFVGSIGAVVLAGGFLTYVAEFELGAPLVAVPVATLLCAAATAACGLAASASALRARPIEAIRRGA
jgi:putative ABC transport system permease protein